MRESQSNSGPRMASARSTRCKMPLRNDTRLYFSLLAGFGGLALERTSIGDFNVNLPPWRVTTKSLAMSAVAIRRRTGSLLRPANQQSEGKPFDTSSPAIDLKAIARANWSSWRVHLRIATIALCLVSIACIAWAYDHSPKGKIDHHVSDGQDVPWILIPVRLHPIPIPVPQTITPVLTSQLAIPHNSHQPSLPPPSIHTALFSAPLRDPTPGHL